MRITLCKQRHDIHSRRENIHSYTTFFLMRFFLLDEGERNKEGRRERVKGSRQEEIEREQELLSTVSRNSCNCCCWSRTGKWEEESSKRKEEERGRGKMKREKGEKER